MTDALPEPGGLLDGYQTGQAYDEAFEPNGSVRDTYNRIVERFRDLDAGEVQRLEKLVADEFRRQGITFTVYSEEAGTERIWPMDLFPRVIAAAEWDELARGLSQRVAALNCFLADLYCGEGAVIADGVVPRWLVVSSQGFERNAMGISVAHSAHCNIAGIDVVRGADGRYRVLEDNLRSPSGISYVVENRAAMAKACSWLFYDHAVQPTEQYGQMLRSTLESMAPGEDSPHIVVLTPGIFNAAYFEHAFLARSMGVELVEGRDLVVDEQTVYSRTIEGLVKVDVIYRRIDDLFLDPVAFRPDSTLGVPGLLGALRAGTVTVCNALGNGVADDKGVYPYVPELIRYYLGAEPIIENVTTYMMWDPDQRGEALARLDELVVKPVGESGGYGVLIGPHATEQELADARATIEDEPRNWIVQELVELSTQLVAFLLSDVDNPGSVVSSVTAVRENMRSVRDRIPIELWEEANGLYLRFPFLGHADAAPSGLHEVLLMVRRAAWAVAGASSLQEMVAAVVADVRETLVYQQGVTDIGITLAEVLAGGAGVCQDFAHLATGMLRSVGVPTRYVSGYLFAADETSPGETSPDAGTADVVSVQTHAWIEAAVPGWGWWALDPTNGGQVGERHVVIGCGRDYGDVPPVRGAFIGSGTAEVDAEVVIGRQVDAQPSVPAGAPGRPGAAIAAPPAPDWRNQQAQQQQ